MTKKPKIAMLCFAHPVDDGRVAFRESVALKKAGYRLRVLGRARTKHQRGVCKPYGIPALALRSRYMGNMFVRLVLEPFDQLVFFVYCVKYTKWADVLHCHEYQSLGMGLLLAKFRGQKVVYDSHEFQPELFGEMFGSSNSVLCKVMCKMFRAYEVFQMKKVDGVVLAHERLKKRFEGLVDNLCCVPNYPSVRLLNNVNDQDVADSLLDRIREKIVVGFVGYISMSRGAANLIKAMRIVCEKRKNVHLLLCGKCGVFESFYKDLIEELRLTDFITMTGEFNYHELGQLLSLIDIGVYTPISEGSWQLSNTHATKIFQYCAFSIPSVLSDIPCHRELTKLKRFSVTVANSSPDLIAEAIIKLVDDADLRNYLGKNAFLLFSKYWNAEVAEQRLITFYNHLMEYTSN